MTHIAKLSSKDTLLLFMNKKKNDNETNPSFYISKSDTLNNILVLFITSKRLPPIITFEFY